MVGAAVNTPRGPNLARGCGCVAHRACDNQNGKATVAPARMSRKPVTCMQSQRKDGFLQRLTDQPEVVAYEEALYLDGLSSLMPVWSVMELCRGRVYD